jgi:hypothetical protein
MSVETQDVTITMDDVRAAQLGDGRATELVLGAMRSRVASLANATASRMFRGDTATWFDEFVQVANVAVWDALARFEGDDLSGFYGYMYSTAQRAVASAAADARHAGVDRDAYRTFAYWVAQCDGDDTLAEQLCQRFPDPNGHKLGRDRAHAARLAWHNPHSIEGFASGESGDWSSDEGEGQVRYADLLVSALGIPDEFITSDDLSYAESEARIELVDAVLDAMGAGAASVLKMTFGIGGMGAFGVSANDEIGAMIGKTAKQVIDARTKGYNAFARRFIPLISDSDTEVDEWWKAFHAERAKSNARSNKR